MLNEREHNARRMPRRWAYAVRRRASRIRAGMAAEAAETGMTTAEYAVGTLAAVAFAAVFYKVITSSAVGAELQHLIVKALRAKF